ncbi:MAG: hypothetical protein M3044_13890 [Thermoproteota archaeon]|nr:hypothetical protein [Thermoproteota archaeon]
MTSLIACSKYSFTSSSVREDFKVSSATRKISKEAKSGTLPSIESTIPKGTSKKVFDTLHRMHVVHAPHRWYSLEEKDHGVNQLRVIGGLCECCLKAGIQFYGGVDNVRTDGA